MDAPAALPRIIRGKLFLQGDNQCIQPALCGLERESGFEPSDGCPQCARTARPEAATTHWKTRRQPIFPCFLFRCVRP